MNGIITLLPAKPPTRATAPATPKPTNTVLGNPVPASNMSNKLFLAMFLDKSLSVASWLGCGWLGCGGANSLG